MLSWKRVMALALAVVGLASAQPTLTTIQDTLYRADGTRFNGTLYITYDSFNAGDAANIATANLAVPIVNGSLRIQLVPTTTASAGAQYQVLYNSAGATQFTEQWAVPPSSTPLRVRDIRVGDGSVVGPAPVVSPVQISDVVGLQNELEIRPMRGVGFGLGRAAIINSSGQLDAAAGSLTDCIRVDGSSGACGSGGGGGVYGAFQDNETPAGTINGSNTTFTLVNTPDPSSSLMLYRNGLLMQESVDYTVSGNVVTFLVSSTPQAGDLLRASYRYADPGNPLGTLTSSQVVCSGVGASTSATASAQLATCTIPAGILGTGDRLEIQYQFRHSGSASGFTASVQIGSQTVSSRTLASSEALMVGSSRFGIFSAEQIWDAQSWGTSSAVVTGTGLATEDTSQAVTVTLLGNLGATSADTIGLENFTVIRYPAQVNP